MDGQPVIDIFFKGFAIGREERNGAIILSKSAIATFVDGDDRSFFPQARKVVFFEGFVENNGWGREMDWPVLSKKMLGMPW